jgi:hypothetical protein
VFSILFQFYSLVPSAYHFKVFGVTVSNKVFTSILALQVRLFGCSDFHAPTYHISQLAISQPPGSLLSAAIGLVAGSIYRSNVFGIKTYRLPQILQRAASILLPLLGTTKPPRRSTRAFPDGPVITLPPRQEPVPTPPRDSDSTPNEPSSEAVTSGQTTMRNWVNELTGQSNGGSRSLRVPSNDEIAQLSNMFPDLRREDIVGALQRR